MTDDLEKSNPDNLPVYDAEIISDDENDNIEYQGKSNTVAVDSNSKIQKFGRMIGTIAGCLGVLSEIKSLFTGSNISGKQGDSSGRRSGFKKHQRRRGQRKT